MTPKVIWTPVRHKLEALKTQYTYYSPHVHSSQLFGSLDDPVTEPHTLSETAKQLDHILLIPV